jgi:hypothetical protein
MAATIADLQALGYECGHASGSVAVEEQALADAQAAADPQTIAAQVNTVTAETVQALDAAGHLPDTPEDRLALATQIAESALSQLTEAVSENVAFHERALQNAREMPDTWHVSGYGCQLYVNCKDDGTGWDDDQQAVLDSLADPGAHAERVYQDANPDAMQAAMALAGKGYTVERPTPGEDTFVVDGSTELNCDGLVAYADTAEPKPTPIEKIAAALEAEPGLTAATKTAIRDALQPAGPPAG